MQKTRKTLVIINLMNLRTKASERENNFRENQNEPNPKHKEKIIHKLKPMPASTTTGNFSPLSWKFFC